MTFFQMIQILKQSKSKKLKFKSESCRAFEQNLSSIQHWIFKDKSNSWQKFIYTNDWELDEKN